MPHLDPGTVYLSWDLPADRRLIVENSSELVARAGLDRLTARPPLIVFDELHKYSRWKDFLKGFFDRWEGRCRILVAGSAALNAFSRGGDSLMGRYFPYRCNPLGWSEVLADECFTLPAARNEAWDALLEFGGFPEPFLKADRAFWRRWQNLRWKQLFREDLRALTRSLELDRIELLGSLLLEQACGQCNWARLATRLNTSQDTVRRWVSHLEALHTVYLLRPWTRNVARSLLQEPRIYFTDWSWIADPGARAEDFIANQLRARIEAWQDRGLGDFGLNYLRDKDGREADFLVSRDGDPWILVEAKKGDTSLAAGFLHMARQVGARWNFQLVTDLPDIQADPFDHGPEPLVVPARTFLRYWSIER